MTEDLQEQLQTTLGDSYRLDRELARGGMSRVFLAHEPTLGRDVVVKVLPPDMTAGVSVDRFEREIQVAARLQHPHIVPVLAAGESHGLPYLVMPYIAGESLRQRLQRQRELPIAEAVRVLRDVATALQYAHARGIVHRDIKPENVLLSEGTAVVTDFGVAKALVAATTDGEVSHTLTSIGTVLGTPAYMAPEQAAGDPGTDHRADIYAWGILAYEILTGNTPFGGRSPQATFAAHMAEKVQPLATVRPNVPPQLAHLVMRAVEKRPADRPQSAAELVQALDLMLESGIAQTTPQSSPGLPPRRRILPYAAVAALAIALTAGTLMWMRGGAASGGGGIRSIAVLPFMDVAGGDDYFAEGMSDELSAALGRVPGLQVASRTSTHTLGGPEVNVREVGRRLNVDAVLEGRVRRAGDRLRVTAQLTDTRSGLSLWADAYEREQRDVFAVQDDIARAISSALQLRLQPATAAASGPETRGTVDLEAYDLYLRGRYHWHRRGADNLRTAIRHFEAAIQRDPAFARAHAGLAIAAVLLPEYTDAADFREMNARAERAAARALTLDSTLAQAYAALGLAAVHRWEWERAEQAYRRALALDPRYPTAHQWYGELLYHLGRTRESVAAMRRSAELDPLAPIAAVALSYAYHCDRQFAAALREAERAVEFAPELEIARRQLAFSSLHAGNPERAYREMSRALQVERGHLGLRHGQRALIAARAGRMDEARADVREMERRGSTPFTRMWAYLGTGDHAAAAAALEEAVDAGGVLLTSYSLLSDPDLDPLREQPAFVRALQKMRLRN